MIDKSAEKLDALIAGEAGRTGMKDVVKDEQGHDHRIKLERLGDHMLALTIHRDQLQDVIGVLKAKGIEPFRNEETDSGFGEYELLYIASQTPETDIIRYQQILDSAA